VGDLTVMILQRPRHEELITRVRRAVSRSKLLTDGDVVGALMAAMEEHTGVDLLMGIGGDMPEAVLAACALKCVGGEMQCRLYPRTEVEKDAAIAHGLDPVEFDRPATTAPRSLHDRQDVLLAHDEQILAVDLDLGALCWLPVSSAPQTWADETGSQHRCRAPHTTHI